MHRFLLPCLPVRLDFPLTRQFDEIVYLHTLEQSLFLGTVVNLAKCQNICHRHANSTRKQYLQTPDANIMCIWEGDLPAVLSDL